MATPLRPPVYFPQHPLPPRTLRLLVAYDGTDYVGWQVQREGLSVQGQLMAAFRNMLGVSTHVKAAGRTDAGVHAAGQVAAADVNVRIPCGGLLRGLNANLPDDIAVLDVIDAQPGFNPRYAARGKVYQYTIHNHLVGAPLLRRTSWHVRQALDVHAMREAAAKLCGEHDFRGFRAADCQRQSTVRQIRRIDVERSGSRIDVSVEGTAFLKNMVRIIAGTLAAVGRGSLTPEDVDAVLQSGDRTKAGPTAPACGLTLIRVLF